MAPAPQPVPRGPRRHLWPRVLVLLLALLLPGAHATTSLGPVLTVAGESTTAEADVLDTALRPPARATRRTKATPRRTPRPAAFRPARTARPSAPVPPGPPHDPRPPRSWVLRC
ncbi:hypothetical protein [Streptomyces sp. NPDC003456]|uniref:hypothetical protein n=1 Tax=Streptomyces sp. NPDC003456 TaxID=3364683 RepID=UPI0036D08444